MARSYTELALLKVLETNRSITCLTTFTDNFGAETGFNGYDIQVNIKYIGNATLLSGCGSSHISPAWTKNLADSYYSTVSLVIDTYITYKDFDDPTSNRVLTFHRRTLQKL